MPPPGGGKRKRGDRTYSDDQQYSRPSPHRPGSLNLAQQGNSHSPSNERDYTQSRGRGGRRSSRGGRGGATVSSPANNTEENAATTVKAPSAEKESSSMNGIMSTTQVPTPSVAALTSPPAETQPYNYTYLTVDVCDSWQTGGMEDVLRQGLAALQEDDTAKTSAIMQELCHSVIYGRLQPLDAGRLVKTMMETEAPGKDAQAASSPTPLQTVLLDSISIIFEATSGLPTDRLSAFLLTAEIPYELLRLVLDAPLLEKLDLIRNTFSRMNIRKQTNLLYRQANFNLMREESEGFAKLMTELFTTSGNEPPTAEIVEETVEKVKAMIGAFDLDVGRSLDVVLDVFGAVLVKQFRFFVKFLRASPWWPRPALQSKANPSLAGLPLWALPGSSDWHLTEEQKDMVAAQTQARDEDFWPQAREKGLQAFHLLGRAGVTQEQIDSASAAAGDDLMAQWTRETGIVPPPGNRDAAQLLGFKLRFYSSSPARDETDVLPDNLIYLSALLIKIGFISLKDLYPHIWRSDEEMDELKQQKTKEKAERERAGRPGAGAKNALLLAGALADDTAPIPPRLKETTTRASTPSREADAEKVAPKDTNEPADQKVLLLKSLLAIGALPEALFILGRFPWLMDLIPDLPEYVHRILHHCLGEVYSDTQPLRDRHTLRAQNPSYETDVPGFQKGQVKIVDTPERKLLRWALLDRNDSVDGTDYRFYWDEWNDNIPICQSVDDVFTLCDTLLPLVGVKIGHDPGLLLKIARIGKHSLQTDRSEHNRSRWLDLSKRILLPSLSLTKSNAGVVNEVFELISNFPVSVRYLMYLEWLSGRTSRNPDIKAAFDQARAETKDILKRISNTNVRPMARALAKIAFANPHIVITTALTQIEVYDSIAEVFVEGARYFTDLGYDVLTWAIVSSMAKAGRSRTQEGGMFTSRWLSALAHFAGKIYKRYGMMRPGPILQYVAEQLEHGNKTDLKMLEQIVLAMGGIATDTNYNDAQLQAMGGGPLLQSQTILQLLDRRHDSRKTSERLVKSLQDTGLAAKFLISMAQQRQVCVFEEGDVPLKAIGNTYDEVHRVMIQYLDLLRTNLSAEDFRSTIPDVVSLLIDYDIRPEIAFWISRPTISKQIVEFDRENAKDQRADDIGEKAVGGDVEMSDHINGGSEEDGEAVETDVEADGPSNEVDVNGPSLDLESSCKTPGPSDTPAENCWHPVMRDVMTAIQPSLPEEVVEQIGTGFYATFWQLSLYDITIPGKSYEDELSRQHKKIAAISADRSDVSVSGTKKKELAKREIADLVDKLLVENKQHLKAFAESKARLQREKDQWFLGMARRDKDLNAALIEHCFLPRLLSSPLDAYFCFKFVKFLHGAGTPNFRTLGFYDLVFKTPRLVSLVFICTSKEADNLGRFLNEVLKDLSRWHSAKTTYEREAWGSKKTLPGFAMKVESGKVVSLLDFETFRRVLYKWHGSLYAALQRCLGSPEYMHVRNAISVLRCISAVYPVINVHGTGLQKAVDKLRDSDKEDLKVSSQALLGALHRREKVWVDPQAFRQGSDKVGEQGQASSQSKTEATRNAPDMPIKNGEDGEVKDTVMTDASTKEEDKPLVGKRDTQARGAANSTPSVEATRPASRPASRLTAPNGSSTPTRQVPDTNSTAKQDGRPTRPQTGRPQSLPRRVSPPPSRPLPATLPSRPELPDPRTGSRESPRTSSRLQSDPHRPGPDPRSSYGRDVRPGYRGPEPPVEEFDRHARRYDRPDGPPQVSREERGYGRESERSKPYDRALPSERERPPTRLPPVSDRGRDGRDRESTPRSRPPVPSEPASSTQAPPRRETDQPTPKEGSATPSAQPAINPARAALIEGGSDQRSTSATRGPGADRSSKSSRPTSPRREEDRRPHSRRDGDERPLPGHRSEPPSARQPPHSSSATEPSSFAPSSRSGGHAGFKRDSRQAPPIDMQHGRLEREHQPQRSASSRGPEQQQDSEVPSGPRSRAAPGGPPPMRAPPLNTQNLPSSGNERPTPTGPSRRHGRTSSYNEPASSPGTSADSAGVHPSRLNQIDPATTETPRSTQPPQSPHQSHPPSGPRGNAPPGAPSGPSPASRGPPSGPHGSELGGRSGRNNRHPLTAVNNTLAQAGTSIRGRGTRQGGESFGMPSGMAPPPPPPPAGPPANHNSGSNGFPPQKDLFPTQNPNDIAEASLWRNEGPKEDPLGTLVDTMNRAKIETIEARGTAEMVEMTNRPRATPPERTTGQLEGSSIHKKAVTGEEAMQGLDHLGMINHPRESMVEVKRLHHVAEGLDQAWVVEVVLELPVKASDRDVDHDFVEDGPERLGEDEIWMTSTGRQGYMYF
ncbi:THO2 plays a role in transcriptional elongation [Exophiala xenobiotica]|nr:THO2 plays a role in transcriptional elongation [Exophiala xenobiotica]KAK5285962.1 THO2 plays a role in transcriptional elongation [Exophiala xenobiotica]KAK5472070.1 THO2 plays a role in transcriptional elongation [Exophiala xenobiotica]